MTSSTPLSLPQLPAPIAEILNSFLQSAKDAFGSDLISVVLFGSAAEGKLRATSDLNLILVLASFNQAKADGLREPLRIAQAAMQLHPSRYSGPPAAAAVAQPHASPSCLVRRAQPSRGAAQSGYCRRSRSATFLRS